MLAAPSILSEIAVPWQLAVPQGSNEHAQTASRLCREAAEEEPRKQRGGTDNSNALEKCGGGKGWSILEKELRAHLTALQRGEALETVGMCSLLSSSSRIWWLILSALTDASRSVLTMGRTIP